MIECFTHHTPVTKLKAEHSAALTGFCQERAVFIDKNADEVCSNHRTVLNTMQNLRENLN